VKKLAQVLAVLAALALVAVAGVPGRAQPRRGETPSYRTQDGGPRLRVAAQAHTGIQPKSVEASPDGSRVYVCNFGRPDRDNVAVFDAQTLERVGTVDFPGNAVESAFSPDGRTLYVSNFRRDVVMVIDVATLAVQHEIRAGVDPKTIVVSPDGRLLYVANWNGRNVSVIDVAERREIRRLRTGVHPRGMVSFRSGRLLVAAFDEHVIHDFGTEATAEIGRISTCRFPRHLMVSPDESKIFVACSSNRTVEWRDAATGRRIGIGAAGENPRSIDLSTDGRYIATADFDSSTVSVIDTVAMRHRRNEVPGAQRIVGLAVRPGEGPLRVYATSWETQELFALDVVPERGTVAAGPPASSAPPRSRSASL
jgi:YVTN family beta-propeller protein